ncbi:mucin-2 isoform X1 [Nilaparvata lugens]|uniref:mucin-2 isoform X2 n=1 Tax=Nilaparvata lugens TaxID=108931 RepID=UPI00193D72E6|nr:mucin-2 isoform X2 [Nilaparvata lugens]XP_039285629.1 mucin-2 isoform X1 [Nilaparvata lugens]
MCHLKPAPRSPRRRKGRFWGSIDFGMTLLSSTYLCSNSSRSTLTKFDRRLRVHIMIVYFVLIAVNLCAAQRESRSGDEKSPNPRGLFSPRMQYDEWTPLGRGDPLKNDPTFDYMPPVLERVQYWMSPAARTPDPPRVTTSTAPPLDRRYQELTGNKRYQELPANTRYQELTGTQQRTRQQYVPVYYQGHRPHHHHYHHHHHNNHPPAPQTILVPPPAPGKNSFQYQANSVYPSTTSSLLSNNDLWETQLATVAASPTTQSHQQPHTRETITFVNNQNTFDITPSPSVLHYILNSELAPVPSSLPPQHVVFPSSTPPTTPTTTTTLPTSYVSSTTVETSTTPNRITTTTMVNPSLTTDPLFSHYKQPAKPIKGPMYLIIEGHSKVKTYGPAKLDKISGIPVQESNDISSDDSNRYERSSR